MMVTEKGERVGCAEAKKQIAWFIHDVSGAAAYRSEVMRAESSLQIATTLDTLIAENS